MKHRKETGNENHLYVVPLTNLMFISNCKGQYAGGHSGVKLVIIVDDELTAMELRENKCTEWLFAMPNRKHVGPRQGSC